jgi:hypothetical protein
MTHWEVGSMRDRLIKLILENDILCHTCGENTDSYCAEYLAEYLIENGVIVPPYKCGTVVYVVRSQTSNGKNLYIRKEQIEQYRTSNNGTFMTFESGRVSVRNDEWSRCVFATLEEAERALKGEHHAEIH